MSFRVLCVPRRASSVSTAYSVCVRVVVFFSPLSFGVYLFSFYGCLVLVGSATSTSQYQSPAQLAHVRLPHYSWSAIEPVLLLSDGRARIGSLLLLCGLQQLTRAPCRLLQS